MIPPIKIYQNDSNLVKRHVLAKIDYFCPLFMHLELKKSFGNFKKKSQKLPTQDLSNIERNKVMKNQPIWGIP